MFVSEAFGVASEAFGSSKASFGRQSHPKASEL
jgi:hypothetical protein